MAEMVASAVVGETLNRISTFLIDRRPSERDRDDVERLEMAHIKMEAALHMSDRWQITDAPMLRWRSRLKRAAQECDDALRHRKQRNLEDEDIRRSSFPRRIAYAAKSFLSASFGSRGKGAAVDESSSSSSSSVNVRRFERFAEGTSEFLRFVEFGGGTPRRHHTFFNPLIGDLLAGKTLRYQALQGGRFYYLGIRPTSFAERGVEAMVGFVFQDFKEPAKGLNLRLILRLSESSDVFGIIIKCLQSAATPHFKIAADDVRRVLIQLPTQDFSWETNSPYGEKEYWAHVHSILTQWLRPDPLCCYEHEHDLVNPSNSNANASSSSRSGLACMYPEDVIVVYLQCHISLSDQQRSWNNSDTEHGRRRNSPNSGSAPLKLAVLFIPHDSPEGIEPAAESYAFEVIDGKEQEKIHRNACLQDADERLLPKAIDHLCQNSESKMYQMCLRSRHGTAHLCVEKTAVQARSAGRGKAARSQLQVRNKRVYQKHEENGVEPWLAVSRDLLKLWVVSASDKLHGSIRSWIVNTPRRN